MARPRPAHVGDRAAGRFQHRRDPLEVSSTRARHDRERAGLCRRRTARHRCVDPAHPELGERRRPQGRIARLRAAHVDHDRVRPHVLGDLFQQRPGCGRVRHDDHHHVGRGSGREVVGELDPRDLVGWELRTVPTAYIESSRDQRTSDRTAHQPQAKHAHRRLATGARPGRGHGGNLHAPLAGVIPEVSR